MALQEATAGPGVSFRSRPRRYYHFLMSACGLAAALLFGGMALLVCADVVLRNTGHGSIAWSVEMTEYILMAATFIAAPWLLYLGDHIRVDILVRGVAPGARRVLELATDLLCFTICAVLAWQTVVVANDAAEQGSLVFKVLVFPQWWLNLPMIFACTLLAIEFARRFSDSLATPQGH